MGRWILTQPLTICAMKLIVVALVVLGSGLVDGQWGTCCVCCKEDDAKGCGVNSVDDEDYLNCRCYGMDSSSCGSRLCMDAECAECDGTCGELDASNCFDSDCVCDTGGVCGGGGDGGST